MKYVDEVKALRWILTICGYCFLCICERALKQLQRNLTNETSADETTYDNGWESFLRILHYREFRNNTYQDYNFALKIDFAIDRNRFLLKWLKWNGTTDKSQVCYAMTLYYAMLSHYVILLQWTTIFLRNSPFLQQRCKDLQLFS